MAARSVLQGALALACVAAFIQISSASCIRKSPPSCVSHAPESYFSRCNCIASEPVRPKEFDVYSGIHSNPNAPCKAHYYNLEEPPQEEEKPCVALGYGLQVPQETSDTVKCSAHSYKVEKLKPVEEKPRSAYGYLVTEPERPDPEPKCIAVGYQVETPAEPAPQKSSAYGYAVAIPRHPRRNTCVAKSYNYQVEVPKTPPQKDRYAYGIAVQAFPEPAPCVPCVDDYEFPDEPRPPPPKPCVPCEDDYVFPEPEVSVTVRDKSSYEPSPCSCKDEGYNSDEDSKSEEEEESDCGQRYGRKVQRSYAVSDDYDRSSSAEDDTAYRWGSSRASEGVRSMVGYQGILGVLGRQSPAYDSDVENGYGDNGEEDDSDQYAVGSQETDSSADQWDNDSSETSSYSPYISSYSSKVSSYDDESDVSKETDYGYTSGGSDDSDSYRDDYSAEESQGDSGAYESRDEGTDYESRTIQSSLVPFRDEEEDDCGDESGSNGFRDGNFNTPVQVSLVKSDDYGYDNQEITSDYGEATTYSDSDLSSNDEEEDGYEQGGASTTSYSGVSSGENDDYTSEYSGDDGEYLDSYEQGNAGSKAYHYAVPNYISTQSKRGYQGKSYHDGQSTSIIYSSNKPSSKSYFPFSLANAKYAYSVNDDQDVGNSYSFSEPSSQYYPEKSEEPEYLGNEGGSSIYYGKIDSQPPKYSSSSYLSTEDDEIGDDSYLNSYSSKPSHASAACASCSALRRKYDGSLSNYNIKSNSLDDFSSNYQPRTLSEPWPETSAFNTYTPFPFVSLHPQQEYQGVVGHKFYQEFQTDDVTGTLAAEGNTYHAPHWSHSRHGSGFTKLSSDDSVNEEGSEGSTYNILSSSGDLNVDGSSDDEPNHVSKKVGVEPEELEEGDAIARSEGNTLTERDDQEVASEGVTEIVQPNEENASAGADGAVDDDGGDGNTDDNAETDGNINDEEESDTTIDDTEGNDARISGGVETEGNIDEDEEADTNIGDDEETDADIDDDEETDADIDDDEETDDDIDDDEETDTDIDDDEETDADIDNDDEGYTLSDDEEGTDDNIDDGDDDELVEERGNSQKIRGDSSLSSKEGPVTSGYTGNLIINVPQTQREAEEVEDVSAQGSASRGDGKVVVDVVNDDDAVVEKEESDILEKYGKKSERVVFVEEGNKKEAEVIVEGKPEAVYEKEILVKESDGRGGVKYVSKEVIEKVRPAVAVEVTVSEPRRKKKTKSLKKTTYSSEYKPRGSYERSRVVKSQKSTTSEAISQERIVTKSSKPLGEKVTVSVTEYVNSAERSNNGNNVGDQITEAITSQQGKVLTEEPEEVVEYKTTTRGSTEKHRTIVKVNKGSSVEVIVPETDTTEEVIVQKEVGREPEEKVYTVSYDSNSSDPETEKTVIIAEKTSSDNVPTRYVEGDKRTTKKYKGTTVKEYVVEKYNPDDSETYEEVTDDSDTKYRTDSGNVDLDSSITVTKSYVGESSAPEDIPVTRKIYSQGNPEVEISSEGSGSNYVGSVKKSFDSGSIDYSASTHQPVHVSHKYITRGDSTVSAYTEANGSSEKYTTSSIEAISSSNDDGVGSVRQSYDSESTDYSPLPRKSIDIRHKYSTRGDVTVSGDYHTHSVQNTYSTSGVQSGFSEDGEFVDSVTKSHGSEPDEYISSFPPSVNVKHKYSTVGETSVSADPKPYNSIKFDKESKFGSVSRPEVFEDSYEETYSPHKYTAQDGGSSYYSSVEELPYDDYSASRGDFLRVPQTSGFWHSRSEARTQQRNSHSSAYHAVNVRGGSSGYYGDDDGTEGFYQYQSSGGPGDNSYDDYYSFPSSRETQYSHGLMSNAYESDVGSYDAVVGSKGFVDGVGKGRVKSFVIREAPNHPKESCGSRQ